MAFYADHVGRQFCQDGGLISGAGADLKHSLVAPEMEKLSHHSNTPSYSFMLLRSHQWEENHVADRVGPRKHNGEAVHAHAEAAGWRHSEFERANEVFIHGVGLLVTHSTLRQLIFEPHALIDGI